MTTREGDARAGPELAVPIHDAYAKLEAGKPNAALRALEPGLERLGAVGTSVELVARGTLLERDGGADEARRCFEDAYERGVPLAALLGACGRYFLRAGRYDEAYRCLSVARPLIADAMAEFFAALPPAQASRFSPLRPKLYATDPVHETLAGDRLTRAAYRKLGNGKPKAALKLLGSADPSNEVAASIDLVARGIVRERLQQPDEARRCFEDAYERGVPLAALLGACGRYFLRAGRYDEAYRCLSVARPLGDDSRALFFDALPPAQICRYSPLTAPRQLRSRRPKFYSLPPVKRALVRELGESGAALVLSEFIGRETPWSPARRRLAGLHEHAREHALDLDELIAPRDVEMSAPPVLGADRPEPIRGRTRSFFVCVQADAVVSSKSNLILTDDHLLWDYQDGERGTNPVDLDVDPVVLADHGDELTALVDDAAPQLDEALSLVGVHSFNFGHFVFEQMFKVWALSDRPGFDSVAIVIDEMMPPQLREMLEFFVGPEHPIVVLEAGASVRVRRLWACSTIAYWPAGERLGTPPTAEAELSDAKALAALIRRLDPKLTPLDEPGTSNRLYLTRKGGRLANRDAVERWFADRGFRILDFADLTYAEQIRELRNAGTVVLEAGSTIYGLPLARPGLRIGVLTVPPPKEYEWHHEIARALGHRLLVQAGETVSEHPEHPGMSAFIVSPERLPRFLEELESMP